MNRERMGYVPNRERSSEIPGKNYVIVALGKNWKPDEIGQTPSIDTKLNTLAGLLVAQDTARKGLNPVLIYTVGHTAGKTNPAESEVMREDLERWNLYQPLKGEIVVENRSLTTRTDAIEVKKELVKRGNKLVVDKLVTVSYHIPRATIDFEKEGISVADTVSSDEYLTQLFADFPFEGYQTFPEYATSEWVVGQRTFEQKLRSAYQVPFGREMIDMVARLRQVDALRPFTSILQR